MHNEISRTFEKSAGKKLRFAKGEVRILCPHHEAEFIVKVCSSDGKPPKLLCLECIMENPDYVKSHKSNISPVEIYLSELVDSLEEMRDGK
jgi:protein-arginine kinase activator protein McsA